jgi:succinoglycan biosynthesis transport protein ExoP
MRAESGRLRRDSLAVTRTLTINCERMVERTTESQSVGFRLNDILFVLFRHKWKILALSCLGFLIAAAIFFLDKPKYSSTAKLLVRYVTDRRIPTLPENDKQIIPLGIGESVIRSEMEILSSWDVALQVVDSIGAERILAQMGGGSDRNAAAGIVISGLSVDAPRESNILGVSCAHSDPEMAQLILSKLVEFYLKRHAEMHRDPGVFDFLTQQTDQLRAQLKQTEDDLKKLKNESDVISVDETRKDIILQLSNIRVAILDAEADLEVRTNLLKEIEKRSNGETNAAPNEAQLDDPDSPSDDAARYRTLCDLIASYREKERALLLRQTEQNPMLMEVRKQLADSLKERRELEVANPELALRPPGPERDPAVERGQIMTIEAKIKALTSRLEKVRRDAAKFDSAENAITQVQRKKDLEEANYRYYFASLERARIDNVQDSGKMSNIGVAQSPSPPRRDRSSLRKPITMASAGGVLAGIGLALLLELLVNPTIKRAAEIEARAPFPLLLSIPYFGRRTRVGRAAEIEAAPPIDRGMAFPEMQAYFEALRDRIVLSFNTHLNRSKLLGVTGCSRGGGTTTVARGLSRALSQDAANGVLLIDISGEQITTHAFRPGLPLPHPSAESENTNGALVPQSLNLLSNGSRAAELVPSVSLAQKLAGLVPELRSSNFDYIVFDMPCVTDNTSVLRLAGFMDKMLLVIEAEKVHRDTLRRVTGMLFEAKASNVLGIFNKVRSYVPRWFNGGVS